MKIDDKIEIKIETSTNNLNPYNFNPHYNLFFLLL